MANIFLTSNGFYTEIIKNEFLTVLNKQLPNPKAVIITTASSQKEKNRYAVKAKNDLLGMGVNQVEFLDIEFEEANKLKQFNVVYINGGNPFNLLHHIRKSGADLILKELSKLNTIFVGVSAGAVILGLNIEVVNHFTPQMNTIEMNDLTALNITEKNIFPHFDREDIFKDNSGKSLDDRLKEFEKNRQNPVVRLKDDQFLLIIV